jgi:sulfur relay protein TusB/DsrH
VGNLYLIDKHQGEVALELARSDDEAAVVLVQDGVYLDTKAVADAGREVYAVESDLKVRGLDAGLPNHVKAIDYGELVDLIVEHKVINFA